MRKLHDLSIHLHPPKEKTIGARTDSVFCHMRKCLGDTKLDEECDSKKVNGARALPRAPIQSFTTYCKPFRKTFTYGQKW